MAEVDFSKIKCKQTECKVSTTGICLEGLDINGCSHKFIIEEEDKEHNIENDNDTKIVTASESENFQSSHSGDAMLLDDCNIVTSSSLTRLIILAGNAKSGKTTLLASLIQLFQEKSSFAGYKFAGSLTLIGLEKRCFKSRISSERDKPDTDRTILLDYDEFIHLKIKKNSDPKINLLFTDVSGEKFNNLSNSVEECKKFELAKRADHFALFIDAYLLSDLSTRQTTKTNSLNILRSLIESEMLRKETYIEIVFSRWDLLLKRENKEIHIDFVELVKKEFLNRFQSTHKRINFFEIASRPDLELGLEFGHGIERALPEWAEKSLYIPEQIERSDAERFIIQDSREAAKYKYS